MVLVLLFPWLQLDRPGDIRGSAALSANGPILSGSPHCHHAAIKYCSINQTKPNQTKPNQTKPNQTKPNQTKQSHPILGRCHLYTLPFSRIINISNQNLGGTTDHSLPPCYHTILLYPNQNVPYY